MVRPDKFKHSVNEQNFYCIIPVYLLKGSKEKEGREGERGERERERWRTVDTACLNYFVVSNKLHSQKAATMHYYLSDTQRRFFNYFVFSFIFAHEQ